MRLGIGFTPQTAWEKSRYLPCNREAPGLQKHVLAKAACQNARRFCAGFNSGLCVIGVSPIMTACEPGRASLRSAMPTRRGSGLAIFDVIAAGRRGDVFVRVQKRLVSLERQAFAVGRKRDAPAVFGDRPEEIAHFIECSDDHRRHDHSEKRKRCIERSCEAFGGSTRDPQSAVEAV